MRIVLAVLLLATVVHAHPGKTDSRGGHQCIKDCAEWDLYYREYHLHDKQGRPVRIARRRRVALTSPAVAPVPSASQQESEAPKLAPAIAATAIATEPREDHLVQYLLLLVLFLLLLLMRVRSKKA